VRRPLRPRAVAALALSAPLLAGCLFAPPVAPVEVKPRAAPSVPVAVDPPKPAAAPAETTPVAFAPEPLPSAPLSAPTALDAASDVVSLNPGRSVIDVAVPASSLISLGVFGPQQALLGFDVVEVSPATEDTAPLEGALSPLRAHRPLDEDSLLPRFVSFRSPPVPTSVRVIVDASEPVELRRIATPLSDADPLPEKGKRYKPYLAPTIGFPAPLTRDEGFFLQSPARYQFARADVIAALLRAFQKTRARFKRDPIAIADISQWDGIRPATDLGRPRHISHEGGRDVDVALAANDEEPSTVRAHCKGVLIEATTQGCGPGTARGFDAQRMAYFLGLLFETSPPVEKIFIDDVYLRELRKAADHLHERRILKDLGFEGLANDTIVRPSPWHTDHLHVRFAGLPGKPAFIP